MDKFYINSFIIFAALTFGLATTANATPHVSGLRISGWKFPNSQIEGTDPIFSTVMAPEDWRKLKGFNTMLPFVLPAPDQLEAGSCLYMSLTGIAEWWLAKLYPWRSRRPDGPIDLSERYMMNIAGLEENGNGVENWKTDSIFLLNQSGISVLNRSYRFTKGWYKDSPTGSMYIPAAPNSEGASYGAGYNWINQLDSLNPIPVSLPKFEREVLFADPASNQWNTGVMPHDIVDRVKDALRRRNAPVQIIYNHYGYWHAVHIVGFDDELDTENCPFVSTAHQYLGEKATEYAEQAERELDPQRRAKLERRAAAYRAYVSQITRAMSAQNGCAQKGVFYVRDSIYGHEGEGEYDYDTSTTGDEGFYSRRIIFREYGWLQYFANHAIQIYIAE